MKESDIRPAKLFKKYLDLSASDAATYFASAVRKEIPCPACDGNFIRPSFEKWGFGYSECNDCGTLYQTPRPLREDFDRFYRDSPSARYWAKTFFPSVAEARRKTLFRPKVEGIAQLCKKDNCAPKSIGDVGAGYGIFLEECRNRFQEARLVAVEPNKDMADICRSKNIEVTECFAEEADNLHNTLDLVVAFEVIEHVHDPLTFCVALRNFLHDGGKVLITGLSVDGFDIRILWDNSKSISPPHHVNFMSVAGFEKLITRAGFSKIDISTPGKLDVDIVKNAVKETPDLFSEQRFVRHLCTKSDDVLKKFQQFLSENQLSSHCWIWATK